VYFLAYISRSLSRKWHQRRHPSLSKPTLGTIKASSPLLFHTVLRHPSCHPWQQPDSSALQKEAQICFESEEPASLRLYGTLDHDADSKEEFQKEDCWSSCAFKIPNDNPDVELPPVVVSGTAHTNSLHFEPKSSLSDPANRSSKNLCH
jgi:hypothetical protein